MRGRTKRGRGGGRGMKDFLKGLLALPFVLIGGFAVYWVGAILFG